MVIIRQALFEDAVHIAHNMRADDRKELQAAGCDVVDHQSGAMWPWWMAFQQ